MDYQRKRELVESKGATLEGVPCNIVAGWRNDYATLASSFPGFWNTTWETVERVMAQGGKFTAQDVTLSSGQWLGCGTELPPALARLANSRGMGY